MGHTRRVLAHLFAALLAGIYPPSASEAQPSKGPSAVLNLRSGPHLFIDDFLFEHQSAVARTVHRPFKTSSPIVTGRTGGDSCFQPYLTVLQDPVSKQFRMWYGVPQSASQTHIAYLESRDGRAWTRPHRTLADPFPMNFGISVIDQGRYYLPTDQLYIFASYYGEGMMIATSADGLEWRSISATSVLKHNHDINSIHWDPLRRRFIAIASVMMRGSGWTGERRIPHQSVSTDLLNWEQPWPILFPKQGVPLEEGETEFYSMSGVINRGDLMIGLVKVLRDDMNATPGKDAKAMGDSTRKAAGLGYTVLAWSRDGRTWQREHEQFIPNNPIPGTWDHAMAWGDAQLIVNDSTYIYYGGYARGHKVARFDERQIGLAVIPRDRYVSLDADHTEGHLITKPLTFSGSELFINARIAGTLKVRLLSERRKPLGDFGFEFIAGDSVRHTVGWSKPLNMFAKTPVRIEFVFKNAQIFGFGIQ